MDCVCANFGVYDYSPGMPLLLSHDVAGAGAPVLLLHSGVCDRRMWDPQWDALARRFRVIRCDLRGFGDTPLPDERFSNVEDLSALLDHEGIQETAVVGSSFGGRVALGFASTYPERVTRIVLLCSALRGFPRTDDVERFAREEDELMESGRIDEAVALNVRTWLGPEADHETRELVAHMQRRAFEVQLAVTEDPEEDESEVDLRRLTMPALVVSGGKDLEQFRKIAEHLDGELTDARHVHLPWAGHLPSLERPDAVSELLLDFLAQGSTTIGPRG